MDKIRGVNLGGWFVLEQWMKPDLFEGITDPPDETVFVTQKEDAAMRLQQHYATFIQEEDFWHLKKMGINSVRLPVPWWYMGESPYHPSKDWIEKAMSFADKTGLAVLIDLHTAPGCQNGFDNGGIQGKIDWPKDPSNIALTVEKLEQLTLDFKHHPSFWGIQVLNEPHWTIDLGLLQTFYRDAYHAIRKHSSDAFIVFHDGFRPKDDSWEHFFVSNGFERVAFDLHLYHCFDPSIASYTVSEHISLIVNERRRMIEKISTFAKVIIGEWSLGLRLDVLKEHDRFNEQLAMSILAQTQLLVYEMGFGWYFWSYKIDRESHLAWDFSRLVREGILPSSYGVI